MINRFKIMQLHMMLAGFLLPLALLYFISGALYTLDIKGSINKTKITVQLSRPFTPDLDRLMNIAEKALQKRGLPLPTGEAELKKRNGSYHFYWSNLHYSVTMKPDNSGYQLMLTHRKRSLLAQVMRIHRAEAGISFKLFAVILVLALITIFASGIYMAQAVPRLRRPLLISGISGVAIFLLLVLAA